MAHVCKCGQLLVNNNDMLCFLVCAVQCMSKYVEIGPHGAFTACCYSHLSRADATTKVRVISTQSFRNRWRNVDIYVFALHISRDALFIVCRHIQLWQKK